MKAGVSAQQFGRLPDGRAVHAFTLDNGLGLRLRVLDYGAIVAGLWLPEPHGAGVNVVLGYPDLEGYLRDTAFMGVVAGRYANRIAGASFVLDGQRHTLVANDGLNCLHGGPAGFGTRLWRAQAVEVEEGAALDLYLLSPDGEMGFPGALEVLVRYTVGPDMSWRVDYEARCDRATVINLTSHAYFNLAGVGSGTALGQELCIPASRYVEVDAGGIPVAHRAVAGTAFDFRETRPIGQAMAYDHCWLLDAARDRGLHSAAQLRDPASGRSMEVLTTEPALQFYAGAHLPGARQGTGICLETQHSPDSPNRLPGPDWPSTVLRPGQLFHSSTLHRFKP